MSIGLHQMTAFYAGLITVKLASTLQGNVKFVIKGFSLTQQENFARRNAKLMGNIGQAKLKIIVKIAGLIVLNAKTQLETV